MDEVISRLDFDAYEEQHKYCALDENQELSATYLAKLVAKNNESYLADEPFGYKNVEKDYILEVCEFIVYRAEQVREKYPDIDWQRVYCNLGNLKILYDTGMLSYAQVSSDLVLAISKNNTEIVLNMKGEDGFTRVMTHEIMHIIQIGCDCEQIENCSRRAGIAVYWDDFSLNTTDWTWLVEGSAERMMCNLTGRDAVTYQYKMDYVCSFDLSVLLNSDVNADVFETMCFYSDPELLFKAFNCQNQSEREEILNLMITTNILQMQPTRFYEVYEDATGTKLNEDAETLDQFSYTLKPSICTTLAKEFYENLVVLLSQEQLTENDLFFLLNLFESNLNQHLKYTDQSKEQINEPFIKAYTTMRKALFDTLATENPQMNFADLYKNYSITAQEDKLNANLDFLPSDKIDFLLERSEWLYDIKGLGVKI